MQMQGKAYRVSIFIGEHNHYHGKPLYVAALEYLRSEGAMGATVLRGIAGFGAHSRIHTASIVTLSADLPIVLVWVDLPERVERLLPRLRTMVGDGLITLEVVEVVQYAPGRSPDPLGEPVSDIMRSEVATVGPDTPVTEIVALLLGRGYRSVPVVDGDGRLIGLITDGDLLQRTGLATRLDLLADLAPGQLQRHLAELQEQGAHASDIMTQSVTAVRQSDPIRAAVQLMADHALKRLPVIDEGDRLVGWVSRIDILRWVEYHQHSEEPPQVTPRKGVTVTELMVPDVPTVGPQARLDEILYALEANRQRRALVVDDQRHVLGIVTDGDLLRRSRLAQNPSLVSRLRALVIGQKPGDTPLPSDDDTAADLMTAPAVTIPVDTPLPEALRLMVQHGIKRLPVVDGERRLVGLLGRASVLNSLLQAD